MPKIMIRQLEERVSTKGLFMGNTRNVLEGEFRRKLEPTEIVEIDDEELFNMLWATGHIDLVPDHVAVTRPLDYKNRREAMLCSPTFKPRGADEELERDNALATVEARLIEQSSESPPVAESPEEDTPEPEPPPKAANAASRRRQRRGQKARPDHGAQAIT